MKTEERTRLIDTGDKIKAAAAAIAGLMVDDESAERFNGATFEPVELIERRADDGSVTHEYAFSVYTAESMGIAEPERSLVSAG